MLDRHLKAMQYFSNPTAPFHGIGYTDPEPRDIPTPDFGGRTRSGRIYNVFRSHGPSTSSFYKTIDELPESRHEMNAVLMHELAPIFKFVHGKNNNDRFNPEQECPDIIAAINKFYITMRENHLIFDPYAQPYFADEGDDYCEITAATVTDLCEKLCTALRNPLHRTSLKARNLTSTGEFHARHAALSLLADIQYALEERDWGFAKN